MSIIPKTLSSGGSTDRRARRIVFVVDDDVAVVTSLKFSLELEGFEVRTFADAGSLLCKAHVSRNAFLVIDYRLPDTNGLDLLQRLRAKGVRAPAVIVTTNPSEDLRRRAAMAAVPVLEKPLLDDALISAIRKPWAAEARLS